MSGWIKVHRNLMQGQGYFTEAFCRNMAWVDMLMLANHKPGFIRKRGIRIELKRGDVGLSLEEMAKRWQWSKGKVIRFLNELETDKQIVTQKNNVTSCISIVNYEKYQSDGYADDTANDNTSSNADSDADGTQTGTQTERKRVRNNKDKNTKEKKEGKEVKEEMPVPPSIEAGSFVSSEVASISEKKEEKQKSLYTKFINVYHEWYLTREEMPPKIDGTQGDAAKAIITYFKGAVRAKAKKESLELDEGSLESRVLESWNFILAGWDFTEIYYQGKTRLVDINSNLQNIIKQIKDGYAKQSSGTNTGNKSTDQAARVKQILAERANGDAK